MPIPQRLFPVPSESGQGRGLGVELDVFGDFAPDERRRGRESAAHVQRIALPYHGCQQDEHLRRTPVPAVFRPGRLLDPGVEQFLRADFEPVVAVGRDRRLPRPGDLVVGVGAVGDRQGEAFVDRRAVGLGVVRLGGEGRQDGEEQGKREGERSHGGVGRASLGAARPATHL